MVASVPLKANWLFHQAEGTSLGTRMGQPGQVRTTRHGRSNIFYDWYGIRIAQPRLAAQSDFEILHKDSCN
jgi:hypothetical protein